jgi:nucleoside-diphosphate-sugar epimerase
MKLAVTGGTGFVGSRLIDAAVQAGHDVRALTRREQPTRERVSWVSGSLDSDDRAALQELVTEADAIVHVAGVINAPDAARFDLCNVGGTLAMLAAATAAGVARFVHVSSLAAREPRLSLYGTSKARAEELVESSGLDWAIVRPPAVYGPGDKETLDLFRMAKLGLVMVPARGRMSVIHVDDLARLLLAFAESSAPKHLLVEADDGRPGGWAQSEFARVLGSAVGGRPMVVPANRALLNLGAWTDRLIRRSRAKLTPDRAAFFSHPDWVASPERAVPAGLWRPEIDTHQGLRETADWYRLKGWL